MYFWFGRQRPLRSKYARQKLRKWDMNSKLLSRDNMDLVSWHMLKLTWQMYKGFLFKHIHKHTYTHRITSCTCTTKEAGRNPLKHNCETVSSRTQNIYSVLQKN